MSIIPDVPFAPAPILPYEVALPRLSIATLGERFDEAFANCRRAATALAGEDWSAHAVHEAGGGTSYVFHFGDALASLRFSAAAAAALEPKRPLRLISASASKRG